MENPVPKPHLPSKIVRSVLYGARYHSLLAYAFDNLNIRSITLPDNPYISEAVGGHIDLSCCHTTKGELLAAKGLSSTLVQTVRELGYNIICGNDVPLAQYPYEAAYNAAVIGRYAFCNRRCTETTILDRLINLKLKLIDCKQGYTKCSIMVVDEQSIITSDTDICKKADKEGIHCLLIEPGSIDLPGYPYGFIGGCAVKLSSDLIALTGTIDHHPNAAEIMRFINDRGISVVYLTTKKLFDVGSIIPLTQEAE